MFVFINVTTLCLYLGGHIAIATRLAYVSNIDEYKDKLEPLMDKLEQQGKWKKVERRIFKRFFLDKEGILWKYRVC